MPSPHAWPGLEAELHANFTRRAHCEYHRKEPDHLGGLLAQMHYLTGRACPFLEASLNGLHERTLRQDVVLSPEPNCRDGPSASATALVVSATLTRTGGDRHAPGDRYARPGARLGRRAMHRPVERNATEDPVPNGGRFICYSAL
ncbi:hypothetical protein Acsp04_51110 [Actinomadura sp. NBRC 104425]|nr:hypothetical protein Acsp04_51110 [Actinomadura sp. NBRC 104425]